MFGLVTKKKLEKRIESLVRQLSFFVDLSVDCHVLEQHSEKNCSESAVEPVVEPEAPANNTNVVTYFVGNEVKTAEVTALYSRVDHGDLVFTDDNGELVAIFKNWQSCVRKETE